MMPRISRYHRFDGRIAVGLGGSERRDSRFQLDLTHCRRVVFGETGGLPMNRVSRWLSLSVAVIGLVCVARAADSTQHVQLPVQRVTATPAVEDVFWHACRIVHCGVRVLVLIHL